MNIHSVAFRAVILLLSCLPLGIEGCSKNSKPVDNKNVFNDIVGYKVTAPPGWKIVELVAGSRDSEKSTHIRAEINRDENTGLQIRILPSKSSEFSNVVERHIKRYGNEMSEHWGGTVTELEPRIRHDVGEAATTARFRAKRKNGEEWYLQQSFVISGNLIVEFQCGSKWDFREEAGKGFNSIVESIEFTSGPELGPED